jgi:hypothetical protein
MSLSWVPDSTIIAWITKHRHYFKPIAHATYGDKTGCTISAYDGPEFDTVISTSDTEAVIREYEHKPVLSSDLYFKRMPGHAIAEVLVIERWAKKPELTPTSGPDKKQRIENAKMKEAYRLEALTPSERWSDAKEIEDMFRKEDEVDVTPKALTPKALT